MATADANRPSSDLVGHEFGPFNVVRRLGVGGMAETFEAYRIGPADFSQRVCLKVVLPYLQDEPDFRELFMREARLVARLRHKNIVGVIDFREVDGRPCMALQLIDGVDLAFLLKAQRRLSHEQVAYLGNELASALKHAHDPRRDGSRGGTSDPIIHRDLSPSNVLVSVTGEVLLTDFGLAKALTEATRQQQSRSIGKVPYMSPEQLREEELDGRSDLFALGVVLFEALSGERPFQGENDPATMMKIVEGKHPSLRDLAPSAPPGLCEVIELLLAKDRKDRPDDAGAVIDMLDPFVEQLSVRRVSRELGKIVTELREVREAEAARSSEPPVSGSGPTVRPSQNQGATGGMSANLGSEGSSKQPVSEPPTSHPVAKQRLRRGFGWALWTLVAIMAAVSLWTNLARDRQSEVDTPSVEAPPTSGNEAAEGPPIEPAEPAQEANAEPESSEPAGDAAGATEATAKPVRATPAKKPARLTVIVFPWGDVWIDGKRRGSAPLKNVRLKPGRHRISAGRGKPSQTQIVDLGEAQRKTVEFDLTK